jgi:hypothetical protein
MSLWAQITGDEISATHTITTTNYEIFPFTTSDISLMTGNVKGMICQAAGANGIRFIVGDEGKGYWNFTGGISYTGSVGGKIYHHTLFKNGTKIDGSGVERKIGAGGDVGAAPIMGAAVLKNSTDIIDFRMESTGSTSAQLTVSHIEIFAHRVTSSTVVGIL